AAYTFKGKYTLSASGRRDAANIFGLNTNDKWKPLWSVGIGWDISKEKFFQIDWLPYLKLRTTYGKQGNVDPSKVAVTTFVYQSNNPFTSTQYGAINSNPNPELKWEQVEMFNSG